MFSRFYGTLIWSRPMLGNPFCKWWVFMIHMDSLLGTPYTTAGLHLRSSPFCCHSSSTPIILHPVSSPPPHAERSTAPQRP